MLQESLQGVPVKPDKTSKCIPSNLYLRICAAHLVLCGATCNVSNFAASRAAKCRRSGIGPVQPEFMQEEPGEDDAAASVWNHATILLRRRGSSNVYHCLVRRRRQQLKEDLQVPRKDIRIVVNHNDVVQVRIFPVHAFKSVWRTTMATLVTLIPLADVHVFKPMFAMTTFAT